MLFRIFSAALLALLVMNFSNAFAAGDQTDREKFRAAYARYQLAIENQDPEAATAAAKQALDLGKGILADDSPSMAALYVNYGLALVDAESYSDAIGPLKEGIKRLEKIHGKNDESLIDPLWTLVEAYRAERVEPKKVIINLKRILRIVEKTQGKNNFLFADTNQALGEELYLSFDQQVRARVYFKAAYETYQNLYDRPAFKTGLSVFWMGKAAMQQKKFKRAEEYFLTALDWFEETPQYAHELELLAHTYLITLYEERGKSRKADAHCQAIALLRPQANIDSYHPLYKMNPKYPRLAAISRREGYVIIEYTVTTLGTVTNLKAIESEGGKEFVKAALIAGKTYRYAPAVKNGVIVETPGVKTKITFLLAD